MTATSDVAEVWQRFTGGGSVRNDGVSRSVAEELSTRVAELEKEVSVSAVHLDHSHLTLIHARFFCKYCCRRFLSSVVMARCLSS